MKILSLDLATRTGWATNIPEGHITSGVDTFDVKRGESPGTRYLRFVQWLREKIEIIDPIIVYYEKAHHRGGAATEVAAGFATHLQSTLAELRVNHAAVHTGTLKKHATGKGNANKEDMIVACQKAFHITPIDDNEADAIWLLDYGLKELTGKGVRG